MRAFADIVIELEKQGVRSELVQAGSAELGSDIAMPCFALAKEMQKPPQAIAEEIAAKIDHPDVERAEALAGYLNVWLRPALLFDAVLGEELLYADKQIVCEYSDPNPFKVLHAGHLYTSIVGDAISNVYERLGASVHRVNFGGDVGLHVAKAMWGITQELGGENPAGLERVPVDERSEWISARYVVGNAAYEEGSAKDEITAINQRIYELHNDDDRDSGFAQIYWECRAWSYDYFDAFYERIGTSFEKYYPESETAPIGLAKVREQLEAGVYVEDQGAVIFRGEDHDLHNRVFINSNGLPTYEAKDVGLALAKWRDYEFDLSVMITGNDITEYMKVVLKSIEQYEPQIVERSRHITHGMVKLAGGVKMSSRLGNFLKATDVLDAATESAQAESDNASESVVLAAVKYSFLKQGIGGDIHFDPQESVSVQGNSGPYLQYAHARARKILAKSEVDPETPAELDDAERALMRRVSQYPSALYEAADQNAPSKICTYLYELAQEFNKFYEKSHVIGDDREAARVQIVAAYANVLADGLSLLGIDAPEQM